MPKFVVLDQSLTSVGGHSYELALRVLQAADRLGYAPVLATHRRFTQRNLLPRHWSVLGVFAVDSKRRLSDDPLDMDGMPLESPQGAAYGGVVDHLGARLMRAVPQWWRGRAGRRYIERYSMACAAVHAAVGLRGGDQVFLPTTSVIDLLGLVRFLSHAPELAEVTWHGLFHRGFLQGREPEYAGQAEVARSVRRQFEYLAQHTLPGQLRLYGTTPKLVAQLNCLSPLEFRVLPYPVDVSALPRDQHHASPRRLRLLCAGFLRREKGKGVAKRLVERIWDEQLAPGHMQLVMQTDRRQARRIIADRLEVPLVFQSRLHPDEAAPILWLRHPLGPAAYEDLIRRSDIGLFLHDGRMYYTQCSGVLVEMLAEGIPVLVPAGSWLADQIADPVYEHLDLVRRTVRPIRVCRPDVYWWPSPRGTDGQGPGPALDRPAAGAPCGIRVPPDARALLISFTWQPSTAPGTYVRVVVQRAGLHEAGRPPAREAILGPRAAGGPVAALLPLEGGADLLTLHLSNAYDDAPVAAGDLEARLLGAPADGAASYPAGQVGLVFADVDQLPMLVRNMREHYAHYLESARAFSRTWRAKHDTQSVVRHLLADNRPGHRSVA